MAILDLAVTGLGKFPVVCSLPLTFLTTYRLPLTAIKNMWIKKKDKVVVLAGKDKGKRGEVLKQAGLEKFVVTKVNMVKRHQRAKQNEQGGIIEKESPLHQSKLMLVCPKCDSPTSPKMNFLKDGSKMRVCRNCSEIIE